MDKGKIIKTAWKPKPAATPLPQPPLAKKESSTKPPPTHNQAPGPIKAAKEASKAMEKKEFEDAVDSLLVLRDKHDRLAKAMKDNQDAGQEIAKELADVDKQYDAGLKKLLLS